MSDPDSFPPGGDPPTNMGGTKGGTEPPVTLPANLANSLIDAITSLGKVVSSLDDRMATVESMVARASVPQVVIHPEPTEASDPAAKKEGMREAMWNRANQRIHGASPESFLPHEPPPPSAPVDRKCKTCRVNDIYGHSKYCLPCLQEQQRNRCQRCGNIVGENGCAVCAAEARVLERIRPGARHPVGEYTQQVVEMISEGFPA